MKNIGAFCHVLDIREGKDFTIVNIVEIKEGADDVTQQTWPNILRLKVIIRISN